VTPNFAVVASSCEMSGTFHGRRWRNAIKGRHAGGYGHVFKAAGGQDDEDAAAGLNDAGKAMGNATPPGGVIASAQRYVPSTDLESSKPSMIQNPSSSFWWRCRTPL
jgi:hypothetical protein